jgi:ElaB/YqjD/DUF883 family membrane-anchored ribosome-binding protein
METVETLICSVERLLGHLPAAADSEMSRLRVQAKNALAAAKAAVASDVPRVREWPGTALAVAAILGLAIGACTGRAVRRGRRSWPVLNAGKKFLYVRR